MLLFSSETSAFEYAVTRVCGFQIIQLKRFEYVREEGRIGKCKRLIDFPLSDFDAASFLRKGVNKQPLMYDCIAIAVSTPSGGLNQTQQRRREEIYFFRIYICKE